MSQPNLTQERILDLLSQMDEQRAGESPLAEKYLAALATLTAVTALCIKNESVPFFVENEEGLRLRFDDVCDELEAVRLRLAEQLV